MGANKSLSEPPLGPFTKLAQLTRLWNKDVVRAKSAKEAKKLWEKHGEVRCTGWDKSDFVLVVGRGGGRHLFFRIVCLFGRWLNEW